MILSLIKNALLAIVFAYVILSWFPRAQYHPLAQAITQLAELLLAPIRRVVRPIETPTFRLDLAPLTFVILVMLVFWLLGQFRLNF